MTWSAISCPCNGSSVQTCLVTYVAACLLPPHQSLSVQAVLGGGGVRGGGIVRQGAAAAGP